MLDELISKFNHVLDKHGNTCEIEEDLSNKIKERVYENPLFSVFL